VVGWGKWKNGLKKGCQRSGAEGNDERLKIFVNTFLLKTKIGFKDYLFDWRAKKPHSLANPFASRTFVCLGVIF